MTDEDAPDFMAAANLSPVSPRPLHNTYTLPQVLPELQDRAEDPNAVPFEAPTFRTAAAAMAIEPGPVEPLDDVAVEGSDDNDSFDYDDDGGSQEKEGVPQELAQEIAGPEENDDYARMFDSPTEKEPAEIENEDGQGHQQASHHVTDAPESMTISEQPDAVPAPTQSPALPATLDPSIANTIAQGSQSVQPASPAPAVPAPQPVKSGQEYSPAVQEALPDTATQPSVSVSQPETVEGDVNPEDVASKKEDSDVQPKHEDVEMTTPSVADATALDIQKLVDEITAKAEENTSDPPAPSAAPASAQAAPSAVDVDLSSLPPKPALTQEQSQQTYSPASFHHASLPNAPNLPTPTGLPAQSTYTNAGAPGTSQSQAFNNNNVPAFASYPNAYPPGTAPPTAGFNGQGLQQTYDEFLADERRHMAEAKWERFPEGSRIFIGNLSQERVSKRDVFELFHRYGRLAQISLKSAYGFVQYHTTADAQAAMNALQGAEVKGRKINLEVSKTQKTKKDRDHSPERRNRGDRGNRNSDRYDGRDGRRGRDDYRQGRSPSPRREDHRGRQDSYGRERNHFDGSNRKRSRSPDPYRRTGQDSYRRRSPSPYGRGRQESDHLDIPRRYGNDVPDVQILLLQDVHKDFVDWIQRAFWECQLKTNVMFLNPRFPRDAVLQRQVLEGVHGVVELDVRAQNTAKIPLQVFDRSAGSNVRFDQYQDLDPPIAAQLVLRTKGSIAPAPAYPPQPTYPAQPYGAPAGYPAYRQPPAPIQQPPAANPDITGLVGQLSQMPNVDGATLQTILASLQQPGAPPHAPAGYSAHYGGHQAHPPNPQVDLNALINNLSAASANTGQPAMGAPMPGYPAPTVYQQGNRGPPPPQAGSSDPARDVENIMATLARIRQ